MEYTMTELRHMLNYMDAQLQEQGRIVDDRLLTRRNSVAQAVQNLDNSEKLQRELGGSSWVFK